MALVAWAPPGIAAELELVAVLVQPGPITWGQWLDALADRVTDMAMQEDPDITEWACRVFGVDVGHTDNPREAGQFLVDGNWNLKTHLSLAMNDGDPFPCVAAEDEDARAAIKNCDFEYWVELAHSMTGTD